MTTSYTEHYLKNKVERLNLKIGKVLGITNDFLLARENNNKICGTEPRYNGPRFNGILVITNTKGILGGGVSPGSPDPISDPKMSFFTPVFRPDL